MNETKTYFDYNFLGAQLQRQITRRVGPHTPDFCCKSGGFHIRCGYYIWF